MAKQKNKKYYAIKEGNGVKDKIVLSWEECKKLVHGFPSVYKSFLTKEEALSYLNTVDTEKIKKQTSLGIEKKKKIKSTTKALNVRLDKALVEDFENKCDSMGLSKELILKSMLEEWLL